MEMASAAGGVPKKLDDDPAAHAAEPWPPAAREEKNKLWRRVLLVGSLVTLPLVAFFVLGRESASTAWLQMAIDKLTAMKNGTAGTVIRVLRVCGYALVHTCAYTQN
jgi:xyloglucan fucosyltransferase